MSHSSRPVFPIFEMFGYGLLFSFIGVVLAFLIYLFLSFIGFFTGKQYDLAAMSRLFGICGFVISSVVFTYRYFLKRRRHGRNSINEENERHIAGMDSTELEEEMRLSDEFTSRIKKIYRMLEDTDAEIQRKAMSDYSELAREIIKRHKAGKRTGVSSATIDKFLKEFPDV